MKWHVHVLAGLVAVAGLNCGESCMRLFGMSPGWSATLSLVLAILNASYFYSVVRRIRREASAPKENIRP